MTSPTPHSYVKALSRQPIVRWGLVLALPALITWQTVQGFFETPEARLETQPVAQAFFTNQNRKPDEVLGQFYYMLGTQMAARGQIIIAEKFLSSAVEKLPDLAEAQMNYGVVLEALDKDTQAAEAYQKSIALDPTQPQPYYSLGLLLDNMGQTDDGIGQLKKAQLLDPENHLISYDLGVMYAKKEDFANSALYSEKALKMPDFAEAYNNYGYALAHLGKYDQAMAAIDKSLAIKPDSAAALDSRGFAWFGMGKYNEALADYRKALELDPTIGEIYQHMAETYEKIDNYEQAIKAYETYLQLTPKAANGAEIQKRLDQLRKLAATNKVSNTAAVR